MRARGATGPSPTAWIVAALAGLAAASAVVAVSMAAIRGGATSGAVAADFSSASLSIAEQRLADGDPVAAAGLARQALRESPISARALRIWALAEQAQDHQAAAIAIWSQASALGWRDVPTQVWLARAQLASGHADAAAERLDAALRMRPSSRALHAVVDQMVEAGLLVPELARRMAQRPYWRGAYLADIQGTSIAARLRLAQQLVVLGSGPTRGEMFALLTGVVRNGQVEDARNLWFRLSGLSPAALYDPDFRRIESPTLVPFEWQLFSVMGSQAEARHPAGIVVTTDGSAAGVLARQLVMLPPGRHRLAVRAMVPPAARAALAWTIRCMPGSGIILDRPDPSAAPAPFQVPVGCPIQFVELRVHVAPQPASVTATYQQLKLD